MLIAKDIITDEVPPLKTSDTGVKALQWMEEFKVSHLPIVNNVDLLGVISDIDIFDLNTPEEPLGAHNISLIRPFVDRGEHIFEVIKTLSNQKLTLIPVVDDKQHYLGVITMKSIMDGIAQMASVTEPGAIIVLELNYNDYSLVEIAQIVETNGAKILSSYITSIKDEVKLELTLKINTLDLTRIIQTFHRYNYTIKASVHKSDFDDDVQDRYDQLMNFLDI
jgi:acetoin utilization protein AcuB